ncbi:MAG: tRNA epoxyqueuosine(34) reductase QueG [Candidatus Binatia bacterium]|jgi:epoxyqueuosine reductase
MDQLKARMRTAAHHLGFTLCGFARVEPLPRGEFVREWLSAGNSAGMHYIGRGLAKRLDPGLVVPDARTVITVGYRYPPPVLPPAGWRAQWRGRIAAYALGDDYHAIIGPKLRALAGEVCALRQGVVARAYVDTGPLLEREWAASGGVGWFGKNTNIIHTEEGSWFFLGEVLTDLGLEPDAPQPNRCGTCTRCLDLCPTQALAPGYRLDARRCISYLTIEHGGAIPTDLRPKLGNWVFGCDVCQQVCPWNEHFARRHIMRGTEELAPYLLELLALSEDEFRARFRNSAVRRAGRVGLARNVAVALGNTRDPAAAAALVAALTRDPAPLVRAHAAWALGRVGGAPARHALDSARWREVHDGVRREIDAALAGG